MNNYQILCPLCQNSPEDCPDPEDHVQLFKTTISYQLNKIKSETDILVETVVSELFKTWQKLKKKLRI